MNRLHHMSFHVVALLALLLSGLVPVTAAATGETVILCAPEGPREVTLPADPGAPSHHDCQHCCLTAVAALDAVGPELVSRPAASIELPSVADAQPVPALPRSNPVRAPPLSA